MALGFNFGERRESPYLQRRDRTFGRRGGRPTGAGGGTTGETGGVGTTGEVTGGVTPPGSVGGTGSGIQPTQKQTPYAGFLESLTRPIGSQYQSQFKERAGLLREYTQGAYETAAEGQREKLGRRGLRAGTGESGIADTAIGRIQKAGAEELTRGYRGLAAEEGRREQEFRLGADTLNLQRNIAGGGLALRGEEGAQRSLENYYRSQQEAEAREWEPYRLTQYGG